MEEDESDDEKNESTLGIILFNSFLDHEVQHGLVSQQYF